MARRRTKAQRDRDAELKAGKLSDLREQVSKLDGLRRLMADDLLAAYVEVYSDYEALNETLARDGLLVDVERGGENNRHVERVKHPGFDMRRNCIAQMADLANKITRFVREEGAEPEDEFDEFVGS